MQAQTTTTTGPRVASSDRVATKAAALAVAHAGGPFFHVSSGTRPGIVYTVTGDPRDADGATWGCSCAWSANGGRGCSHVRAAVRYVATVRARRARRGA